MTFAWPLLLWLLVAPFALLAWELTHRRRTMENTHPKILQAEASARALELSHFTASGNARTRRRTPRFWLCLGLALAIGALARPQWGRLEEPVFDQSREILIAIDLSRSMLAEDVRPSRLARAKLLIQSLLEKLAGERVGLVVFAGTAFLQSPLSADYEILREFLPELNPDFLPQGGSDYSAMLDHAVQAFNSSAAADRFLIVLSDGEATDTAWRERVEAVKSKGVRVLALGIGTPAGAMIPDGSGNFVKDERGAVVLSKLESSTLQELASATQGIYRDASGWIDLAGLVKQTVEAGRKGRFVEKNTVRYVERFQWPLALALWCLLLSFYFEIPVRPRVREIRNVGNRAPEPAKAAASAAAAATLILLLSLCVPNSGFAAAVAASPAAAPATAPEPSVLAKIVGRLASAETRTARDWAEFAGETVSWGQHLQSAQQPVPEGPVRDALGAVSLGAKLDASTANWPKLREDLEALLQKPDEEKKQDQQKQNQEQKDQQKQEQQQEQKPRNSPPDQNQKEQSEKNPSGAEQPEKKEEQAQPGESAFGDMKEKSQPPPPQPQQGQTQKVGGEQKNQPAEPTNPSLTLPLQKLEQLRTRDSPGQLFQLMETDRKQPKKSGKDW